MTLEGYWPLNEDSGSTAYDYSGRDLHGSVNGPIQGVSGLHGMKAYEFDGDDDYVSVDETVISSGKDSLTISAWIYITGNPGNSWNRFLDVQDGTNGSACTIYWDDNDSRYGFSAMGASAIVTGDNPTQGVWMHWVGALKNGTAEFYLDGVKRADDSTTSTTADSVVSIGKRYDANDQVQAKMCEVRIYNHALTRSEIQYLYSTGGRGRAVLSEKSS